MNELQIFESPKFGKIRTIEREGEPWFVGKDVAAALGYSNTRDALDRHVDNEDKNTVVNSDGNRGNPNMVIINESGLYSLVLSSKLPTAKAFKRWITSEVIPTIRKTGGYVYNDDLFLCTYLPNADEATKTLFKAALATLKNLNAKIEEDKPKVQFAEHVGSTKDLISVSQLAKLAQDENIHLGRNKLFSWLRKNKYLSERNEPYQKYIDSGYFKVKEVAKQTAYGSNIFPTTFITGKGQIYFIEKLRTEFN